MKRTLQLLGGILVFLALCSLTAYVTMITPSYQEIASLAQRAQALETELRGLDRKLAAMPAAPAGRGQQLSMLRVGDEALALKRLYGAASGTTLMIEALEVLNVFVLKGSADDVPSAPSAAQDAPAGGGGAPLPQLDENGMPVGAMTEESDDDQGIEVLPIRLKLRGTVSGWGEFIHKTEQTLGLSGIRTMRMEINDGTIAKGTVEFVLPLSQSAGQAVEQTTGQTTTAAGTAASEGEQQ